MKSPSMPFYGRDFYGSAFVRGLPRGVPQDYLELLWYQWDNGSLPGDPKELQRLLRVSAKVWLTTWRFIAEKFPQASDGKRYNARLEEIRTELDAYQKRQSNAGQISVKKAVRVGGKFTNRTTNTPTNDSPTTPPTAHQVAVASAPESKTHPPTPPPSPVRAPAPGPANGGAPNPATPVGGLVAALGDRGKPHHPNADEQRAALARLVAQEAP